MGRQQAASVQSNARPKRRATNAHVFRYLQTGNPSKLEENDLRRALEASLEECPDFWPEDSASCSSSEQGSAPSSASCSSNSITGGRRSRNSDSVLVRRIKREPNTGSSSKVRRIKTSTQHNHPNCNCSSSNQAHPSNSFTAIHNCCPLSSVHNRYKPVAKKNIYNEADFFHDGIMEYIEYQLTLAHEQHKSRR